MYIYIYIYIHIHRYHYIAHIKQEHGVRRLPNTECERGLCQLERAVRQRPQRVHVGNPYCYRHDVATINRYCRVLVHSLLWLHYVYNDHTNDNDNCDSLL